MEAFNVIYQYFIDSTLVCKITSVKKYNTIYNIGSSCTYCKNEGINNKKKYCLLCSKGRRSTSCFVMSQLP